MIFRALGFSLLLLGAPGCRWGCGDLVHRPWADSPGEPPPAGEDPLPEGSPCDHGPQCASGHCVGALCCEAACDDPCLGCAADGRCGPSAGRLMVSARPDRSSPQLLQGARLDGAFFVFAQMCQPISAMRYYWDEQNGQTHAVADQSPYDFSGATGPLANSLSTLVMPKGLHAIIGVPLDLGGSPLPPLTASATFGFPADDPGQERVLWSDQPDRSNPKPLEGAQVRGVIRVFLAPGAFPPGSATVRFYLDDPAQASPVQVEQEPPYDLGGGSVGISDPFQTTDLANGPHSLQVALRSPNLQRDLQVQFTVAN